MKIQIILILTLVLLVGCGGGNPSDSGDDNDTPLTEEPTDDTTPPSAPGGLEGDSGDTIVELSWNDNGESDLAGYNLYRAKESFSEVSDMTPENGSQLLANTNYTDEGLENGSTYYYRLTAVDESENESSTSRLIEVTPFSDPPSRPK